MEKIKSTPYKGISLHKHTGRYEVYTHRPQKPRKVYIGLCSTLDEAVELLNNYNRMHINYDTMVWEGEIKYPASDWLFWHKILLANIQTADDHATSRSIVYTAIAIIAVFALLVLVK